MEIQFPSNSSERAAWEILIVDDDEDDFLLVREMLNQAKGRKHRVSWAPSYEDGWEALISNRYDAVLVDYDLGLYSGIQLIREANEHGISSPLILYTGRGNFEIDMEAMQAGATLYLTKGEANPLLLERIIRYAVERKQSDETLRRARNEAQAKEDKLRLAQQASGVGFFDFDLIANSSVWTEQFEKIYGISAENPSSENWVERIHPDDQAEVNWIFENAVGERQIQVAADFRIIRPDGEVRWLSNSGIISYDAEGTPVRISGAAVDITERKQAEEALRKSEERFHKAFNASPNAQVISRQEDGCILIINDSFEQLFGYRRAEVLGKRSQDLNMFADPTDRDAAVRQMRADKKLRDYEIEIRTKTGAVRQAMLSVEMISIDGEELMLTVIRDVTEQKQAEAAKQELARSLELDRGRLAAVLENLPVGVWIADETGQLIGKNEQADRIWAGEVPLVDGIDKYQEYIAWFKDSGKMLLAEDYPVAKALRTERLVEPVELRIRRFDGSEGTVLASAAPIKDREDRLVGAVGVNVDITEQHQAEETLARYAEQLAQSNQDLEKFAFIASHDLQEPLRKIVRFGDLLERRLTGKLDDDSTELLRRMQNAAARMQVMILDLLALSQIGTQGRPFEQVDLNQTMVEVISDLEGLIESTGGQVLYDRLPTIDADPLQMLHLLQNMVSNALKFHKPEQPPVVQISAQVQDTDRLVAISVADNGIGFEMKYFERILEPFQRLHGSEYGGSGMGMAICKRIVERHGGQIEAESTPGEGTTFIVSLPQTQPGEKKE